MHKTAKDEPKFPMSFATAALGLAAVFLFWPRADGSSRDGPREVAAGSSVCFEDCSSAQKLGRRVWKELAGTNQSRSEGLRCATSPQVRVSSWVPHVCCWETFYIFADCGLVVEIST